MEPIPNEFMPRWSADQGPPVPGTTQTVISLPRPERFVYAPHFYDLNVLFFKAYTGMSVDVQALSRGAFILNALYFGTRGLMRKYVQTWLITVTCAKLERL